MKNLKNKVFMFLFLTYLLLSSTILVYAKDGFEIYEPTKLSLCDSDALIIFQAIGYIITGLKILVPIIMIIMSSVDFGKMLLSGEFDELKTAFSKFLKRFVAAAIIFFIPGILNYLLSFVTGTENIADKDQGKFKTCQTCLLDPTDNQCTNVANKHKLVKN